MKRFEWIFAFLLVAVFSLSLVWWHRADNRPSSMDETRHMQLSVDYSRWLLQGVPLTNEWAHVYPPLYHLSLIPAFSTGTPAESKAAAMNVFHLLILLAGCVLLSRSAQRPAWEGIAAAALCAGYAYVEWTSRRALIDFPLMAWVTLSMAFLARTKGFSLRSESLAWGAVAGLGLLLKPPFVFFSIGPVIWVLAAPSTSEKTKNFFTALGLCAAICVPWYFWQSAYFIAKASGLAMERTGIGTDPRTLSGCLLYGQWFLLQMGLSSLIWTAVGIALALTRRLAKEDRLLLVWILSGYVILTLLLNKDPRHTLPLLPALAILATRGWGNVLAGKRGLIVLPAASMVLFLLNAYQFDKPAKEDWKHAEILQLMEQRHDSSQPLLLASVLSHQTRFFARTLKWSAMQQGIPLKTVSTGDSDTSFLEFLVRRNGDQGSEAAVLSEQWDRLRPESRAFKTMFSACGHFSLPDQSRADVYCRDPHPHFNITSISNDEVARHLAKALQQWVQGPIQVEITSTPGGLREGHLERVRIRCDNCAVRGIPIQRVDVTVEKPWVNLYRLWDEQRLGLLAFEALKPSVELDAADLRKRFNEIPGLTDADVQFINNRIQLRGRFRTVPICATLHVEINQSNYPNVTAVLDSISIAHLPWPGWILGKAHRQVLPLYPIPDFPGNIKINQVVADNGRLVIS